MDYVECSTFNLEIHLFPTNTLVNLHNRCMLKSLNTPIARCTYEHTKNKEFNDANDE